MGYTCNSVIIKAPVDIVFDVTNQIENWKNIWSSTTTKITVLERQGNKIIYNFKMENGQSWTSYRLLFKEHNFIYATRSEPLFPFEFIKIIWLYTSLDEGTKLTWIEQFSMDKDFPRTDAEMEAFINEHSVPNMNEFKDYIENLYRNK